MDSKQEDAKDKAPKETPEELTARKNKEDEEKKAKIKVLTKEIFGQIKTGCKKEICFAKYCLKNPTGK